MQKVSIIVAVYNHGKYIEDCLNSLIQQVHRPNEIIVVDDGSTDDTPDILSKYSSEISVITTANKGLGAATNIGLRACTGDYFGRLDSDDLWDPTFIHKMLTKMKEDDLQASFCYSKNFLDQEAYENKEPRIEHAFEAQRALQFQCGLFNRSLLKSIGFLNENRQHQCDMEWIGKLVESKTAHGFVDEVLHRRRIHDTNLGHTKSNQVYVKSAFELIKNRRVKRNNSAHE